MTPFQRYVWMIFIMITAQCQSELRLQMAPKVNSRILPEQFVLSTLVKRLRNRPSLEKTNCRPRIPGSFVQKNAPKFQPAHPAPTPAARRLLWWADSCLAIQITSSHSIYRFVCGTSRTEVAGSSRCQRGWHSSDAVPAQSCAHLHFFLDAVSVYGYLKRNLLHCGTHR